MTTTRTNAEETCLNNQSQRPLEGEPRPSLQVAPTPTPRDSGILEKEASLEITSQEFAADDVSAVDPLEYPEGGTEAWLVVFGSFCAMISVFGLINSSAVFESYFSTHQLARNSSSEIGWIFSLYLFIVFFGGVQVGPIFDHYGGRILIAVGCVLICASLLILSWCETYYQIILTYSVLGGIGGALLNPPAYAAIGHYFKERRGFATGIATTAGGVGGIVFPLILRQLLPTLGFAWSCRILALIMLGLSIPANLFIKSRLTPARGTKFSVWQWPDFKIFRDPRFAFSSVGVVFMEWGLFVPLTFIVSYAAKHGQHAIDSFVLLAYLNAASVVGRVVPGLLADKLGRFNVIIGTIALCVATVLGLWLPAGMSQPLLIAFVVLFGFASGSNLGLIPVCIGQLCETARYGTYFSTTMMVASFGTLSSVPIGGALLEIGGHGGTGDGETAGSDRGWMAVILFSGVSYAIALVFFTTARVLAVGWKPLSKF